MATTHPIRLGALAAALLLAAVAAGCSGDGKSGGGGGGDAIVFGVLAPLSGPSAARGRDLADGARMAVDDLNVEGGVIGRPVASVAVDDACTAAGATKGTATLVRRKHVAGAVGGICDAEAAAAARAFGKAGLPFLVTSANAPSIVGEKTTPTAFLTNGTPYQEALATSHWLAITAAQQLAVVTDGAATSDFLARKVIGLSPPPTVVSRQTLGGGQSPIGVVRTALKAKPDVVYWAGSPLGAGSLVAGLRRAGYKGRFVASARSDTPTFLAAAGASAEGAYVVTTASPQNLPAAADWARRFATAYGRAPGRDALQAYDDIRALAQAVTQTGEVDGPLNSKQLAFLADDYTTFLRVGLQFANDHTPQEDNHVVVRVRGGALRLSTALRSQQNG